MRLLRTTAANRLRAILIFFVAFGLSSVVALALEHLLDKEQNDKLRDIQAVALTAVKSFQPTELIDAYWHGGITEEGLRRTVAYRQCRKTAEAKTTTRCTDTNQDIVINNVMITICASLNAFEIDQSCRDQAFTERNEKWRYILNPEESRNIPLLGDFHLLVFTLASLFLGRSGIWLLVAVGQVIIGSCLTSLTCLYLLRFDKSVTDAKDGDKITGKCMVIAAVPLLIPLFGSLVAIPIYWFAKMMLWLFGGIIFLAGLLGQVLAWVFSLTFVTKIIDIKVHAFFEKKLSGRYEG